MMNPLAMILMSHTSAQIVRKKDIAATGFSVRHAKFGFARNAYRMLNVIYTI